MSLKNIDIAVLILTHVIPIFLIIKFRMYGYLAGVLFVWISLYIWGIVVHTIDPGNNGNMINHVWLFSGWLYGIIIFYPVYFICRRIRVKREQTDKEPEE